MLNSEFKKLNIMSTQMSHINHKYMDYLSKYVREYLTCVHTWLSCKHALNAFTHALNTM